jgi:hypothetical protein
MQPLPSHGRWPSVWRRSPATRAGYLSAALALLVVGCGDPVGPPRPASLALVSGADQEAPVTDSLAAPLVVRVVDSRNRAVPATLVRWAVTGGGGRLSTDSLRSDGAGQAQVYWVLGEAAGDQTVTASVAGLTPVTFHAEALPGPLVRISPQAPSEQSAEVGTAVQESPAVRAEDSFGNAIPGVAVAFDITEGDGTVEAAPAVTGSDGVARVGAWILGTMAGPNALQAAAPALGGVGIRTFRATGTAGAAAAIAMHEGSDQIAAVGAPVPIAPAVAITDAFGNPVSGVEVAFQVTVGGGNVSEPAVTSDASGVARVGTWTMGPDPGPNELRASAGALGSVAFVAEARDATINLSVSGVHLNQGNQSIDQAFGLVEGRPALLRVIVSSNEAHEWAPSVRVRLYEGATLLRDTVLPPTAGGLQTDPDPYRLDHTWNLRLEAADVVSDLAVSVTVDPDDEIAEIDEADNEYPGGGPAPLGVRTLAPLRLVLFPIEAVTNGTTAEVNAGNLEQLLASTRRMLPVEDVETTIRSPFSTEEDLSTPTGWSTLLSDLQALRTSESAADEYYHGIIRNFSGIAYGGLAYVPGSNGSSFRTGLSVEHPDVIVHELGHNLGRPHSPCGGAGGPDPGYPHPDATLGGPGYDVVTDVLIADPAYRDFMSYCSPEWTSDYTFRRILDWRTDDPRVPAGGSVAAAAGPAVRGLLLWGRIGPDGVVLNPALELEAPRPSAPSAGPNVLRGLGESGEEIFRVAVEAVPVADGDPAEAHFATFVPLAAPALESLRRVEVETPFGSAARVAASPAAPGEAPTVRLGSIGTGAVSLEWDAARHPIALVRDRASGAIVAFARGGEATVALPEADPAQLVVDLSDGVTTRRARPQ